MVKQFRILIILSLVLIVVAVIFTFYSVVRGNFTLAGIGGGGVLILVAVLTVLCKNLRIARTMGNPIETIDRKSENDR